MSEGKQTHRDRVTGTSTDEEAVAPRWDPGLRAWVVGSYEGCKFVARNDDRLFHLRYRELASIDVIKELRGGRRAHRLLHGDEHAKLHRWWLRMLSPDASQRYNERFVRPLVRRLIDSLSRRPKAELYGEYASALGPRVLAAVLGLPYEDDQFVLEIQATADAVLPFGKDGNVGPDVIARALQASRRLNRLLQPTIEQRRVSPGGDAISVMWAEGPQFFKDWNAEDVQSGCRDFLLGGSAAIRAAIANAVYLVLSEPTARAHLMSDREKYLPAFVEESLRLNGIAGDQALPRFDGGTQRVAKEDLEFNGVTIRKDEMVIPDLKAANRDPQHYEDPTAIDFHRSSPRDHLAFFAGHRTCPGAALARVQLATALDALLARFPNVRLDPHHEPPSLEAAPSQGYKPLHVIL